MDEVITAADASSSLRNYSSQPSLAPSNFPLVSAFLACAIAQFLKIFTHWFKERKWDSKRMLSSGGMPSSHSATVTALAVAIGIREGLGGSAFAIAVVLACVVMYDATGVRLHAGRQAELLNQIVCELPPEHPVANVRPLRDSLGHTPLQVVAGALLGAVVAYLTINTWLCEEEYKESMRKRIGGQITGRYGWISKESGIIGVVCMGGGSWLIDYMCLLE